MQTLTYGSQLPQTGDKGNTLFTALEFDIQKLDSHNHDGVNSAPISAFSIASGSSQILAANWAGYGGPVGDFRQLVQMPPGYFFDQDTMSFRTTHGDYAYLKVLKAADSAFYVYCNDPTQSFNVVYGG